MVEAPGLILFQLLENCRLLYIYIPHKATRYLIHLYDVEAAPRVLVRLILPPATSMLQSKAVPSAIPWSRSQFLSSRSCQFKCR
jgi:hypothetical protein